MAGGIITYRTVTLLVFAAVLIVASISDIRSRIVSDAFTALLFVIAAYQIPGIGIVPVVFGAILTGVPFLIAAVSSKAGMIGGADAKIAFGIGAVLGVEKGCLAILVGTTAALIVELVKALVLCLTGKRSFSEAIRQGFPLVPFLGVAAVAVSIV